ncbi:MutS-related protein [Crocinitomix catalasitica]|uniref:MutS-related protein n=1 Tax=Crocinitomix catalasitica TaxID=184607 RepID=UPI0004888C46|nr:DNA mismatch repair protein MutS [Crocinitomix catalasitica]
MNNMSYNPEDYYNAKCKNLEEQLVKIKKQLLVFGLLRISIFLLTSLAVYLLIDDTRSIFISLLVGIVLFLYLVSKNENKRREKSKVVQLLTLNKLEINVINRNFDGIKEGLTYLSELHDYNQDIDLFGKGSVFQMINRTSTLKGEQLLAEILNSNLLEDIKLKQEAIAELSKKIDWRQNYQAIGALIKTEIKSDTILNWLRDYKSKIPNLFKYLPTVYSLVSVTLFGLYLFSVIEIGFVLVSFFGGLFITGVYLKKINDLYSSTSAMTGTFTQYSQLLDQVENEDFEADLLKKAKKNIYGGEKKASAVLRQLSKELNSLDQRNNILFALFANGLFLWDLKYAFRIENWIKSHTQTVENWFEVIEFFDAYNSFGNFAYNSVDYVYPELVSDESIIIEAADLGHPLLIKEKRVDNDFKIDKESFIIITGANMAGKSTFLRTVAINIVLANVGLPVCATKFNYRPIKLISSMRTSDSLQNDESYFFSELKRLKFIVESLKKDTYFVILDEILKGTNSKDKAEGSAKFVSKLVNSKSTGIIATHDLSLCELSETYPAIENKYFDAEIVNDELYFDYRFKDGICQNMNASFLLRKMEII